MERRDAYEIFAPEVVDRLMQDHDIPDDAREEFENILWSCCGAFQGVEDSKAFATASKRVAKQTADALAKALRLLERPGMLDRIATSEVPEKLPDQEFAWFDAWGRAREQVCADAEAVRRLASAAERAVGLREAPEPEVGDESKHDRARYRAEHHAVRELAEFWRLLDRPLEVGLYTPDPTVRKATPAVAFVHDCLVQIRPTLQDYTVHSILAEVREEARNAGREQRPS